MLNLSFMVTDPIRETRERLFSEYQHGKADVATAARWVAMFDPVEEEVLELIRSDSFLRFTTSEEGLAALKKLCDKASDAENKQQGQARAAAVEAKGCIDLQSELLAVEAIQDDIDLAVQAALGKSSHTELSRPERFSHTELSRSSLGKSQTELSVELALQRTPAARDESSSSSVSIRTPSPNSPSRDSSHCSTDSFPRPRNTFASEPSPRARVTSVGSERPCDALGRSERLLDASGRSVPYKRATTENREILRKVPPFTVFKEIKDHIHKTTYQNNRFHHKPHSFYLCEAHRIKKNLSGTKDQKSDASSQRMKYLVARWP
eukprot:g6958.t1